jgi:anti-anti-sigma factor
MRLKLASRIMLSIIGILLLLAILVSVWVFLIVQKSQAEDLENRGFMLADMMSYSFAVLISRQPMETTDDWGTLQRIAEKSATLPAMHKIVIVNRDGVILASSDEAEIATTDISPQLQSIFEQSLWERQVQYDEQGHLVIIQPVNSGDLIAGMEDSSDGLIEVIMDTGHARNVAWKTALQLLGGTLGGYVLIAIVILVVIRTQVIRPVNQLATIVHMFQSGDRSQRIHSGRSDEIGVLSRAFDAMADEVGQLIADMESHSADLEQQRVALSNALEELQTSIEERSTLTETIREISTPVIKIHNKVVMVPLIGSIDSERAQQIQFSILKGIEHYRARKVIIDLTGVPVVDTQVAATLLDTTQAAQLLGVEVIIVGISPEVSQSMVHLGVDLSRITTLADLQSGVFYALHRLGIRV